MTPKHDGIDDADFRDCAFCCCVCDHALHGSRAQPARLGACGVLPRTRRGSYGPLVHERCRYDGPVVHSPGSAAPDRCVRPREPVLVGTGSHLDGDCGGQLPAVAPLHLPSVDEARRRASRSEMSVTICVWQNKTG